MGRWTEAGFVTYSLDYYKEQLQDLFKEAFGSDFLVDDSLPQGVLIQRIAELLYNVDMDGVQAFSLLNLNTTTGIYLDMVGGLRGLPRTLGTSQTATIKLTINPNNFIPFTIPAGHTFTLVDGGGTFKTISGISVTTTNTTTQVEYLQTGNSGASLGSKMSTDGFSQIIDIEVTGLADGQGTESDADYRRRLQRSYPVAGQTIQYVQNLLAQLPEVRLTATNYNDTDETVGTLGPYTTEWMVVPYDSASSTPTALETFKAKVAKVIIDNKMPGAPTAGNTTQEVVDLFDQSKTVNFTIPTKVNLEISVQVATPEATGYIDLSGVPAIQEAIAAYINNLTIGDDVSYSRCMAPLTADSNFDVISFKMRARPNAVPYVSGTEYPAGSLVTYQGITYQASVTTSGVPGISPDWTVYNVGWVENQNFTIGPREYAAITTGNIVIGV